MGKVNAGEDIITCGIEDPNSSPNKHMYLGVTNLNAQKPGQNQTGEWTCLTTSTVTYQNQQSNATTVYGLQRYAQQTQPGYWANYNMANVFVWSLTYTNPTTGHKCSNSDTVQVIWLAPFTANAGKDVYSCAHDANLNAKDQGAGAMTNWWVPTPSTSTPIEYSNQRWGGTEKLIGVPH